MIIFVPALRPGCAAKKRYMIDIGAFLGHAFQISLIRKYPEFKQGGRPCEKISLWQLQ